MLFYLYFALGVLTLSFYQWSSCADPRGLCHEGSCRVVVTRVFCPQITSGPSCKVCARWSANLARRCRYTFDGSFEITVANDARNSSVERVIHTLPPVSPNVLDLKIGARNSYTIEEQNSDVIEI